jgi:hypothetical protein
MGLLETLGPFLGISGDNDDLTPELFSSDPYYSPDSKVFSQADLEDVIVKFNELFGLEILNKMFYKKGNP